MGCCISREEEHSNNEHHVINQLPTCTMRVPRHVQAKGRRQVMTAEYVNIMEAARRCGVSDKTIRRWIHAQKLRAQFPQLNRSEIAVSDLEPFLPGHLPGQSEEPLKDRVAALEQQMLALERQVQQMVSKSGASRAERSSASRKRQPSTGPLPNHLVSVLAFAELHRIPEQKVLTHID